MSARQKFLLLALLVLHVLPLWLYPLVPSQDGPSHLYNTVIFNDLLWNSESFFGSFYEINWRPFPNWTFTILASVLCPMLSILTAEKIILTLYLVGFVCATFYFVRSINAEKTILGFGAFLFGYNWFLWMGFYNFCLSVPLALFVIGYGIRHRGVMHPLRVVLMAILLLLLYFSHVVSFAVALLVLGFLYGCFGQKRLRSLGELGLCAFPSLIVFVAYLAGRPRVAEPVYRTPIPWLAANTFSFKIGPWFGGMEWVWFVALWLVLGTWLVLTCAQLGRWQTEERIWWMVVGMMLALSLLVPHNFLGGSAFNERLALFFGLFLLAALSIRAWTLPISWLTGAFMVLVVVQLVYIHICFLEWNRRLEPFRKAAAHIEPGVRLLPLMFAANVVGFYVNPLLHADSCILMEKRCASPTNYEGYRSYFPVRYKDGAPLASSAEWFDPQSYLQRDLAKYYEYVLLWNSPEKALKGFDGVFADGDVQLLKRR